MPSLKIRDSASRTAMIAAALLLFPMMSAGMLDSAFAKDPVEAALDAAEKAEEDAAKAAEDAAEDAAEEAAQEAADDAAQDAAEEAAEQAAEQSVDEDISESVDDKVDEQVDDSVGKDIEDDVEDDVQQTVEDGLEDEVEQGLDGQLADRIEARTESRAVDNKVERDRLRRDGDAEREATRLEARAARDAARAAGTDDDEVDSAYKAARDDADRQREAYRIAADADRGDADRREDRNDGQRKADGTSKDDDDDRGTDGKTSTDKQDKSDEEDDAKDSDHRPDWQERERRTPMRDIAVVGDSIELRDIDRDERGFDMARDEWVVIATRDTLSRLEDDGFHVRSMEALALAGEVIARIETPAGLDAGQARERLRRIAPDMEVDRNHLYSPQSAEKRAPRQGARPRAAFEAPPPAQIADKAIGLIDTRVAASHPALQRARITQRDFVSSRNPRPELHGTAIASILVGDARDYRGLVPDARLFAASVFEDLPGRPATATTVSLVRALEWMAQQGVGIVNMSLTGPPNAVLGATIDRLRKRGVVIVAAIGNDGPSAAPLYPAGYETVVSVTATSLDNKVYRLANRGAYLDFAAPGVNILHAAPDGGLQASTGTSMAAPFVAAALLAASDRSGRISDAQRSRLEQEALDLGSPGKDEVYGYGRIRLHR